MIEAPKRNIAARIIFRSARLPFIYTLFGVSLVLFSFVDDFFQLTIWKNVFNVTDIVGNIFIAMAVITFVYNIIVLACWRLEKNLSNTQQVTALVIGNFRKSFKIIFLLVALKIIITLATPSPFYISLINNIINTIIIGFIGWIAIQVFYTLEAMLYQQMLRMTRDESVRIKALYTKLHIIRNIATVVIAVVTIAAILMSFSSVRNIGISLLASAGFLTALAGLAAQRTLFSLFSGLQIALSQTIKIGDVVVIENTTGTIEEITFTYVTLKLADRRRLILPINFFLEKPFQNWSQDNASFKDTIYFYVDYQMPIEPLREHMNTILQSSPYWDGNFKKLYVSGFNENAVEVGIQASASHPDHLNDLRAEIREKMANFIREKYPNAFPKSRSLTTNFTATLE